MTMNEINSLINEYEDDSFDTEAYYEQEDENMMFEVIPFSQSEQDYVVSDEEYYGKLEGLVMGIQFEARNVRDRRFPVGKLLYFDVSYIDGVPEDEADFMNSYAEDLGWELTGRVVFRGYGTQHWWAEERDWYILDATPEQIAESRQYMAERDWGN